MKKVGLVPAAGMARRLGISSPKELLAYEGQAIIDYSLDNLLAANLDSIVIVIRKGKEAIQDHISEKYPEAPVEYIYQVGEIGNLIDAIKASYLLIRGHEVYFCMADTKIAPNPFVNLDITKELTLLCFQTESEWMHFGVVDTQNQQIVDKPKQFVNTTCWGALVWNPAFTERIMQANDFTCVLNLVDFDYYVNIEEYKDIGIKKLEDTSLPIHS